MRNYIIKIKDVILKIPIFYRFMVIIISLGLIIGAFEMVFSSIKRYISDKSETLLVIMQESDEYIKSVNTEIDKIYNDYTYRWTAIDLNYGDKLDGFKDYYDNLSTNLDEICNDIDYAIYSDKVPEDNIPILKSINEELGTLIEKIDGKSTEMNEFVKIDTKDDVSQIINQTNILLNITSFYEEDYEKIKESLSSLEKELKSLNINITKFKDKKPKQIGIPYTLLNEDEITDIQNIRNYTSEIEHDLNMANVDLLSAISNSNVDGIFESSSIAYNLTRQIGTSLQDSKSKLDLSTNRGEEYLYLLIEDYYNEFKNLQKLINNDLPELVYAYGPTGNGSDKISTISLIDSLSKDSAGKATEEKITQYNRLCDYLESIDITKLNNRSSNTSEPLEDSTVNMENEIDENLNLANSKNKVNSDNTDDIVQDVDKQEEAYEEVLSISDSGDTVELVDESYRREDIEYYMYMIIDEHGTSGDMRYIVEKETLDLFIIYSDGTIYTKSEFLNDRSN